MNPWLQLIIASVLIVGFLASAAVELYKERQWRKLKKRWEAQIAQEVKRLDDRW